MSESETNARESGGRAAAVLLGLLAVAANPWAVAAVAGGDGPGVPVTVAVIVGELCLAVLAVLAWRRPAVLGAGAGVRRAWAVAAAVGLVAALGANGMAAGVLPAPGDTDPADPGRPDPAPEGDFVDAVEEMTASEELLLALTPRVKTLADAVMDLHVPHPATAALFADSVEVTDLADAPAPPTAVDGVTGVTERTWAVAAGSETTARTDLDLWRPLLEDVAWFDHAKFKFKKGSFTARNRSAWEALTLFSGLARMKDGTWCALHASMHVTWTFQGGDPYDPASWRISAWHTDDLGGHATGDLLFDDVTAQVVRDPAVLRELTETIHHRKVLALLRDGVVPEEDPFQPAAIDARPGIACVDINGDGWDDLYVMPRLGRNLLLVNRGDGTFAEEAERWGLDVRDHCTTALFADFDNDGDPDLFLGRSFAPSLYLERDGDLYVDRSADAFDRRLPALVSGVSAADFDGDGLLDLYVATYAQRLQAKAADAGPDADTMLAEYLPEDDAREFQRRSWSSEYHAFLSRVGPPNVLLRGVGGGRFEEVRDTAARVWRHSYHAGWADWDGDGDPDLYVANDFSPNRMLRNDDGMFTDVTEQTGTADVGFGMGVTWGDWDGDGRDDLYVSNMFSKAGGRITAQIPGIDQRFVKMAHGNSLFVNGGDRFDKVSGTSGDTVRVEAAGWSWGSQFCDVDNDGDLDLYALSGNYTAPREVESPVDT